MILSLPVMLMKESTTALPPSAPSVELYTLENIAERVYEAATHGTCLLQSERKIVLEETSLSSLVTSFEKALGNAVDKGYFTHILLPQQEFTM